MSKFHVGQRVRIVSCPSGSIAFAHIGKEAVVNEIDCESRRGTKGKIGVTIAGFPPYGGKTGLDDSDWCFSPHELEPLNPPKSQIDEILAMKDLPDADCRKVAHV